MTSEGAALTTQPFEVMEHTGEAGIVAHGATLAEAFANAAQGLTATMTDLDAVRERETREVAVEAPDREALLVEFLNELVFLFDTQGFLVRRAEVLEMDATHLRARCHGEKADRARHDIRAAVKAATYHMLLVEDGPPARVRVIFDV